MVWVAALQFCVKFERKKELRSMCDALRKHVEGIEKYQNMPNAINFNNPESLQIHLEIRLAQLNAAQKLDLWQVCMRTSEVVVVVCSATNVCVRVCAAGVVPGH